MKVAVYVISVIIINSTSNSNSNSEASVYLPLLAQIVPLWKGVKKKKWPAQGGSIDCYSRARMHTHTHTYLSYISREEKSSIKEASTA